MVLARIPDGEGEHPPKFEQALGTPTRIGLQHHFGIGMAYERRAFPLKLCPNVAEVVNLSVVDNPVAGLGIEHGLVPERRQVQNGQAPATKADFGWARNRLAQEDRARIVGPAMREGVRSAIEQAFGDLSVPGDNAED